MIWYLSTGGGIQLPEIAISPDKIGHLVAYAILAWLWFSGFKKIGKWSKKTAWTTTVCVSLYGVFLEIVQWAFFPHRFFEVWDMIANITGALLAFLIFNLITNKID